MKNRSPRNQPDAHRNARPFFSLTGSQPYVQSKFADGFFQPKLAMGRPGDAFEQEADSVADAVVNRPQPGQADSAAVQREEFIQRQADMEDEPVQMQAMDEEEPVQAQAEDEEMQAGPDLQRQAEVENEEPVQAKAEDEEVQAKADPGRSAQPLASRLAQQRGKGSPLPDGVRTEMEGGIGADFSSVRVHTDGEAVQMNRELGAKAFTNGRDIYFNEGTYAPGTRAGKHLLAHELTHVVQQGKGR